MSEDATATTLRPATRDDVLCLSVLAMQVFLDTYATGGIRPIVAREVQSECSQAAFERALEDPCTHIAVAHRDAHLLGFMQLTLGTGHALAPPGPAAELVRLYVQRPFLGTGLGQRLLREGERLATEGGATVLWLTAWVHNERALRFYRRQGYGEHGATPYCFEDEVHENRLFARALGHKAFG